MNASNKIILGIRPEKISIIRKPSRSKAFISATIIDVSYFGEYVYQTYKVQMIGCQLYNIVTNIDWLLIRLTIL